MHDKIDEVQGVLHARALRLGPTLLGTGRRGWSSCVEGRGRYGWVGGHGLASTDASCGPNPATGAMAATGFFLKRFRGAHCDLNDLPTLDPELYRNLLRLREHLLSASATASAAGGGGAVGGDGGADSAAMDLGLTFVVGGRAGQGRAGQHDGRG